MTTTPPHLLEIINTAQDDATLLSCLADVETERHPDPVQKDQLVTAITKRFHQLHPAAQFGIHPAGRFVS
jgi:hypothetical protein